MSQSLVLYVRTAAGVEAGRVTDRARSLAALATPMPGAPDVSTATDSPVFSSAQVAALRAELDAVRGEGSLTTQAARAGTRRRKELRLLPRALRTPRRGRRSTVDRRSPPDDLVAFVDRAVAQGPTSARSLQQHVDQHSQQDGSQHGEDDHRQAADPAAQWTYGE